MNEIKKEKNEWNKERRKMKKRKKKYMGKKERRKKRRKKERNQQIDGGENLYIDVKTFTNIQKRIKTIKVFWKYILKTYIE